MLIPRRTLDAIVEGRVTLAFRRWRRPSVKAGGRLRTSVGELAIEAVDRVELATISEEEATKAGFATRAELLERLARRNEGEVYRVRLRYKGADPRVALREEAVLAPEDVATIAGQLDAIDRRSQRGPWTGQVLALIEAKPATLAAELAEELGRPKLAFKADVRRLKELGLTISLERGYRLSPRGEAFVAATRAER
jgi:biotin operon repressor